MKKIVIAIDGLSGTGKGTTSKGVAETLGYIYLDTWSMYRAVTLYMMRNWLIDASAEKKLLQLDQIELSYWLNSETWLKDMYLHEENIEHLIRTPDVWMNICKIANIPWIRRFLKDLQQSYWKQWWIVADGRDMWTVVFPGSAVKVFMTCDSSTRATRRVKQLEEQWKKADYDVVLQEILHRDNEDYLWDNPVNKKADDAYLLDTTDLTIQEQIDQVVARAQPFLE